MNYFHAANVSRRKSSGIAHGLLPELFFFLFGFESRWAHQLFLESFQLLESPVYPFSPLRFRPRFRFSLQQAALIARQRRLGCTSVMLLDHRYRRSAVVRQPT